MLRSTFAGFTTAQLGLRASQKALDVTGQNIANINTEGYTRQRVDIVSLNFEKGDIYSSDSNYRIGFGVEITGVSQIRDPFLDIQYRSQISKVGTNDAHDSTYQLLADIFDESSTTGVRSALSGVEAALKSLSSPVGSGTQISDSDVRAACQTLVNLFHNNGVKVNDVRSDIIASLQGTSDSSDVRRANELLEEIAQLNTSIKNSEILGNGALELKDQRNLALDELASFLPIDIKYHDEKLAENFSVEELTVTFKDKDGTVYNLIDDNKFGSFSAKEDANGKWGLTIKDAVTGVETPDILDQADLINGTFKGTLDMLNCGGLFDGSTTNGIPFYQKAFDTLVSTFANTMNALNNGLDPATYDPDVVVDPDDPDAVDPHAKDLFTRIDDTKPWAADNIRVSEKWISGEVNITMSTKPDAGSDANDNVLKMLAAMTNTTDFKFKDPADPTNDKTFFKGSFGNCYINIETTLGTDGKSASKALENHISVLNQTSNNRDNVSAVWMDEEVMNLMQYSKSYSAAARLMTTLDEALDKLINGTGVVGR